MHMAYSLWICWNVGVHIGMFSVFLHISVAYDKLDDAIALTMRLCVRFLCTTQNKCYSGDSGKSLIINTP